MIGRVNTISNMSKGMIFFLRDQISTGAEHNSHNYFVLGCNSGICQCMYITSLTGKVRFTEVPILCTNGKIGYIVTNKIFTRMRKDFDNDKYRGMIDEGIDDFVELLMDLYNDSLGVYPEKHDDVMRRYEAYCTDFFAHLPEHVVPPTPEQKNGGGYTIYIPSEVVQAVTELENAAGKSDVRSDENFKAMIHRHPKYWDTKDLETFLNLMDSHKNDPQFKMTFLGVSSPQSVHQKVYLARKELRSRRSASENFTAKFSN